MHTSKIKEASWRSSRDIEVWPESSQVISANADYLKDLDNTKDSARLSVETRVLPLQWAMSDVSLSKLDSSKLFVLFTKNNNQFVDTDLLDAM